MKFNVKSPCAHCPFRNDIRGYLRKSRAEEIVNHLSADDSSWFSCHETTTSKGRSTKHPDAAQCAGAMLLQVKLNRPNIITRVAIATGALDLNKLNNKLKIIFNSYKEFIQHHARG